LKTLNYAHKVVTLPEHIMLFTHCYISSLGFKRNNVVHTYMSAELY